MATAPIVEKIANPQGGMADPNATIPSDHEANKSPPAVAHNTDNAASGLVDQLAGMELRDGGEKPINHLMIPAHKHDERKLFVGGLPTNVSEAEFLQFFEQFGEVIDSVVMIDRVTKRSRGFGFVTFASEEVALSLLNSIPGKTGHISIQGKRCEIKASEPKSMSSKAPRYIHGYGQRVVPGEHHVTPPIQGFAAKPAPPSHHAPTLPVNKGYSYPTSGMTPHPVHPPSDRYYGSRNFDQTYNHNTGYASNSMYSGYQYSGYEAPYHYQQYAQYSGMANSQGYYENSSAPSPAAAAYGQNYPASGYGARAYPNGGYYYQNHASEFEGQTGGTSVPTSVQGAYRSDGSLDSYGEYYEENVE